MSLAAATGAIARLTWKRLWRGRTIWVSGLLVASPIALAAMSIWRVHSAEERWSRVAELTLRSLVLLAPVIHLAPSLGEEQDARTYSYLWSRPMPRAALILGKLAAIGPVLLVGALASLALAWLIVAQGAGGADVAWLGRGLLGAGAGVVAASAFSVGAGTLFRRHPLVVAVGYVFFAEQVLPEVPAVSQLSTLYHVGRLAALPRGSVPGGDILPELAALAGLSAIWLGLAIWRVSTVELGAAER